MSDRAANDHDHDREPGNEHDHVPSFVLAPEPVMDHDPESPDRDEAAPTPPAGGLPGFVRTILALVARIPLPSLGSERHEVLPDLATSAEASDATPGPAGASPATPSGPRPLVDRFSIFSLKTETRVGLAALVSTVVLVGALVARKSWSGKPITLSMESPVKGDGEAEPAVPEVKKDDARKDEAKKPEAKPGPEAEKSKDAAGTTPEPVAAGPNGPEPRVGADPTAAPATLPPPPSEAPKTAVLGNSLPTALPPLAQEGALPKPPDSPPEAADPLAISTTAPPAIPAPTTAGDPKPKDAEINPAPTPAPVTTPPAPVEPPASIPVLTETNPPAAPVSTPPPATIPEPVPAPVVATGPVPADKPPTLETVPAVSTASPPPSPVEPAATATGAALGAGWAEIPSGGRRIVGSIPIVSTPSDLQAETSRIADGPRYADDAAAADQLAPVVHVVAPGENFWTISRLYYRSGRFYKALHAANRKHVPDIRQLWVGTVLRIPPPEALDRSLIDPPGRFNTEDPATSTASGRPAAPKSAEPADEADLAMPARPRLVRPDPEAVDPPRRPTYKVKAHETLRSIARDTLNDPSRVREIYNLNRDTLDDISSVLVAGTTLTLPEDANVGRRAR